MKNLIIAIYTAFLVFIITSCASNKGSFLLSNRAKEPISRSIVTVCGQTIELKNIQPTKSVLGFYGVTSDSHYEIGIEFQSGKRLRKEMGYVTNGFDFYHEIIVTDTDIELGSTQNRKRKQGVRLQN